VHHQRRLPFDCELNPFHDVSFFVYPALLDNHNLTPPGQPNLFG